MRRAIGDLEQFADKRLFEELSEGMPLIVDNAARLDDTAHRLHGTGSSAHRKSCVVSRGRRQRSS